MSADRRQRLSVRTIRVTLASALQHIPPDQRGVPIARARELLAHVREEATAAPLIAEIDAFDAELGATAQVDQREG